jgi:hypothetical protein
MKQNSFLRYSSLPLHKSLFPQCGFIIILFLHSPITPNLMDQLICNACRVSLSHDCTPFWGFYTGAKEKGANEI